MKKWVIQSTNKWVNKDGKEVVMLSYFKEHLCIVFPMNSMEGLDKCKKYDSRIAAMIDKRKFFAGQKTVKVIPFQPLSP